MIDSKQLDRWVTENWGGYVSLLRILGLDSGVTSVTRHHRALCVLAYLRKISVPVTTSIPDGSVSHPVRPRERVIRRRNRSYATK
jgi:hypothetical protein